MKYYNYLLAILLLSASTVDAKPKGPWAEDSISLSMRGDDWTLYDYGARDECGVTECGTGQGLATLQYGFYFDLPIAPDLPVGMGTTKEDWRGYLVTRPPISRFRSTQILTLIVQIEGAETPSGNYSNVNNNCQFPSHIRPHFQSGEFIVTAPENRWWSEFAIPVIAGTYKLQVPLQPQFWSNTFGEDGEENPSAFINTIQSISHIGVTMGGGCFYGHGINASSPTRIILKSYTIQ